MVHEQNQVDIWKIQKTSQILTSFYNEPKLEKFRNSLNWQADLKDFDFQCKLIKQWFDFNLHYSFPSISRGVINRYYFIKTDFTIWLPTQIEKTSDLIAKFFKAEFHKADIKEYNFNFIPLHPDNWEKTLVIAYRA